MVTAGSRGEAILFVVASVAEVVGCAALMLSGPPRGVPLVVMFVLVEYSRLMGVLVGVGGC